MVLPKLLFVACFLLFPAMFPCFCRRIAVPHVHAKEEEFDEYAEEFEEHLVRVLDYKLPEACRS